MRLEALLDDWLPRQRWFAGKGRDITSVRTVLSEVVCTEPSYLAHTVIEVAYDDGQRESYQLPLGLREGALPEEFLHGLEHAVIGEAEVDGRTGLAYDASVDAELTSVLLRRMAANDDVGRVRFRGGFTDEGLTGRVLGAEQSNTSVVFSDVYVLKLYRRIVAGLNPDLEVTRALTGVGCKHVPEAVGWIELVGDLPATLGLLQPFYRSASEGWSLAIASVRDLYAERDLHADEVGGDFAGEAFRLGGVAAEVHADLANALPSRLATVAETGATVGLMQDRLSRAIVDAPALAEFAEPIREAYAALAAWDQTIPVQRVHGDFHLGQTLRIDTGWVILDFEGEPARPLAERTALMSPLRDVAGMLRSFDYAARHLLAEQGTDTGLEYRAVEWAQRNRDAFCEGYAENGGTSPYESGPLLRAFELDKAVYEVVYETRNRPSWLPIPLSGIERLVH